jgi:hypothetical protein
MTVIQRVAIATAPFLLAVCVAADSPARDARERARERRQTTSETTEEWSRVFKIQEGGSLHVSNVSGDIEVVGGGGSDVRVNAIKRVRTRHRDEGSTGADDVEIRVSDTPRRIEIETEYPRHQHHRSTSADVSFKIQVPAHLAVAVRSVSGAVRLEQVHGEAEAESVSGDVLLTDVRRLSRAKTVSGSVRIGGAGGDVINAATVSGELVLDGVKAKSCELQSVSGRVVILHGRCDRGELRSVSGEVEFNGELAPGGRYEFNSHSGDVKLFVGSTPGFQLVATTFSGNLRSGLTLKEVAETRSRYTPSKELRGTYGDGSAYVAIKTFSGSVIVEPAGTGRPRR